MWKTRYRQRSPACSMTRLATWRAHMLARLSA
ncbi:Uncharacterised protein [Bordetella pertussis]|nr:Uncharacterised protein [Bordetella pertussis]